MSWSGLKFWAAAGVAAFWLGGALPAKAASTDELERRINILSREIEELKKSGKAGGHPVGEDPRTRLGGYMELHYLTTEGGDGENFDFHRYVLYVGHRFNDWIQFHSELEVEHSFVLNGHGEVSLEQAYVNFQVKEDLGARAGIVLVPMGIVNQYHEPPNFHGVERPDVDARIIPSTWSAAGAGIFGRLGQGLTWQLYGINALEFRNKDDDGNTAAQAGTNGIRDLRQNQFGTETNIRDIAVAWRLDYAAVHVPVNVGFSYYGGRAGDKLGDTAGNPKIRGLALDGRYRQDRIDFVGEWAQFDVDDASKIKTATGTDQAERLEGWYAQGAYWLLQPGDRKALLRDAGIAAFVRFEKFDTAKKMPSNAADRAQNSRDRRQWVYGFTFKPVQNLAVKLDYTSFKDSDGTTRDNNKLNAGIGWQF